MGHPYGTSVLDGSCYTSREGGKEDKHRQVKPQLDRFLWPGQIKIKDQILSASILFPGLNGREVTVPVPWGENLYFMKYQVVEVSDY